MSKPSKYPIHASAPLELGVGIHLKHITCAHAHTARWKERGRVTKRHQRTREIKSFRRKAKRTRSGRQGTQKQRRLGIGRTDVYFCSQCQWRPFSAPSSNKTLDTARIEASSFNSFTGPARTTPAQIQHFRATMAGLAAKKFGDLLQKNGFCTQMRLTFPSSYRQYPTRAGPCYLHRLRPPTTACGCRRLHHN